MGLLFDVQRFSTHDGPGIRTTVFFKGCPLSCPWCHNPESLAVAPQLAFQESRCIGCGACREVCQADPLTAGDRLGSGHCRACQQCIAVCPTTAREIVGAWWTVDELVDAVEEVAGVKLGRRYNLDAPRGVAGRNSDNTNIRKELGWEPSIPFRQGIELTYAWIYDQYLLRARG